MYQLLRIAPYLIVFFMLPAIGAMGGVIKGSVLGLNGSALPYCTLFLEGTTIGTTANGNGDYELAVSPGLYHVICQYIGYKQASFNISITGNEVVTHNFVLQDQSLEMKEVTIHANAEDPAYNIIRQAIAKRPFHLNQVKSFQTSIYLKIVMRSRNLPNKFMGQKIKTPDLDVDSAGKGVLYLSEEYADYYAQDGQEQTLIRSVHESGDPNGMGLPKLPPIITFYENNINIFSTRGSISPISDNALYYYKYKYLGQFTEQGHTINKIQVTQKREFEPCFNGTIYITDNDYAIHSLDLTLLKESGINLFDTVKIEQLFLPQKQDEWVIKSQLLYLTAKIFAFDVTANAASVYNNQKINQPIPDTIFHKKTKSIYDATANKKDSSYWQQMRLVPLETDEKRNFIVQDTLNRRINSPAYLDSVRRKKNKLKPLDILLSGKTLNSKENKNAYSFNSLLFMSNFNIVEGFNFAPKFTYKHRIDTGKYLNFATIARYGINNTHFNNIARLYYTTEDRHWRSRKWMAGIDGGKYVFQYNPDNPIYEIMNSADALLWHENDLKIYERYEGAAYLSRNCGNGFTWFAKVGYQQRLPLENTTNFSFDEKNDISYKNNLPYHLSQVTTWQKNNAALVHLSLSWLPGYTYVLYPDYKQPQQGKYPKFTLVYDKGIPGIFESQSNFDKYKLSMADNIRLRLLGDLAYNIAIGGFLNSTYVSVPDLMHPYGNRGLGFASPYLSSFQFMQYYEYSNKEPLYGEAHIEYKLKGLLSNKIPLLRKAQLYIVMGNNTFYANPNNYYTEAFIGLDNIGWKALRIFRFDFVQSWDSNLGHNSGFRLGISGSNGLSFSFNNGNNDTQSEW